MTNAFTASRLFGDHFRDPEIAGLFDADALLREMRAFEIAWTETLVSLGAVAPEDGAVACDAMRSTQIDLDALDRSSDRNGLPVPGLVEQLRDGLPAKVAKAIHTGATSQDVLDTAMVRMLLAAFDRMERRLQALVARFESLPLAQDGTIMGRTRMQAALPVPVSARVQGWAGPLRDHLDRLNALRAQVGQVQLGGPVGLRDVPEGQGDAAAAELARRLGLRVGPVWHTDRSTMVEVGNWCTLVAGSLGKMGQDIALMAQQGIGEIALRGGGGSSAMPHKQNPVRAETLVTLARYVAVQQGGLAQVMVHEQERSGAAWALEWMILPAMVEATGAALRNAGTLIEQVDRLGPS